MLRKYNGILFCSIEAFFETECVECLLKGIDTFAFFEDYLRKRKQVVGIDLCTDNHNSLM